MIKRATKLRFRRRLRMRKLQVEEFGQQAEQQLERNFFRRLERLAFVRRFVAAWLLLLVLLGGCVVAQINGLRTYYQVPQAVPGGTYTEGILGSFTNANPLYATTPVDTSVSKLLFASLMTYDEKNNLKGDLAESIQVDDRGTTYTVKLKPNLTWHDGKPLTAEDVVFTYQTIQHPDAQSPLRSSWKGITVAAGGRRTVTFTLPNQLSAFPYSLTNGIVPKHLLAGKSMSSLRTLAFNSTQPVGAGPFKFKALEVTGADVKSREERIALEPFEQYHAGRPKLSRFVVHSFREEKQLIDSFRKNDIDAMVGLTQVPPELESDGSTRAYNLPQTAAVMTFFKASEGVLADVKVRQALVRATDNEAVIQALGYPTIPVREPLLQTQVGYNPALVQLAYNPALAKQGLEEQGWHVGKGGLRFKDGTPLTFNLIAQDNSEYATVSAELQKQWRKVGVDVEVVLQSGVDFQTTLSSHGYDALLYGISIGKDPDVYVYWDSRQADPRSETRLNFSEFKSQAADIALQAGRTRADASLRAIKYQPFLQAWRDDAPAVGLYQPRFLYVTRIKVYGLNEHPINAEVERYTNVANWMIRSEGAPQTTF
jgi:peptide/nickel transport system substrate-binding protein